MNFRVFLILLRPIPRRSWILAALIALAGAWARFALMPHRHYVFYDEYEHISIARNMLEGGGFSSCEFYVGGECLSAHLPNWGPGFHFLLSMVFGLFGADEGVAYLFNASLGSLSVALVFVAVFLLLRDDSAAIAASAMTAFLPLHLAFSGNASLEMLSFVFILVGLMATAVYIRARSLGALSLLSAVAAFLALIRPENLLFAPLFLALIRLQGVRAGFLRVCGALAAACAPALLYIGPIAVHNLEHPPSGVAEALGLLGGNLSFWLGNSAVPIVCALLAASTAVPPMRKTDATLLWCWASFFALSGSLLVIGRDLALADARRYNLQLLAPVLVLAAGGWARASGCLERRWGGRWRAPAFLSFFLGGNLAWCLPSVSSGYSEARFQEQHDRLEEGRVLGGTAVFVGYCPALTISGLGAQSVHISHLLDPRVYETRLQGKDLVLVNDHFCRQDDRRLCSALRRAFRLEPVRSADGGASDLFYRLRR